jgi:hypothetical protein
MKLTAYVCAVVFVAVLMAPRAHAQLPDLGETLGDVGESVGIEVPTDPGGAVEDIIENVPPAGGGSGSERSESGLPLAPRTVVVDHAAALKAVRDRRALPLNDLLKGVARNYRGEVIDVQLIRHDNTLLYQVKMLDGRGRVSVVYFNAANGSPARPPPG